ncbi:DinB family protein [Arthrobacter sp. 35W]|uniref:DinB family protein n=1 Tax=Arthrobacter sp. 35W TaxID=1132441 RepID=UPI0004033114|nr:DinB family protein [Arthrobacter sp. 35W]
MEPPHPSTTEPARGLGGELADIAALLADQRRTFLIPMRGLTEEQSRTHSTDSALTLGSLVKHVTATEAGWLKSILEPDENAVFNMAEGMESHTVHPDETFEQLLAAYHSTAAATTAALAALDDLDRLVPLPVAPWQPEKEYWTVRRILLHVLRETAQHSGHADIIREQLDGANTTISMGADAGMDFS